MSGLVDGLAPAFIVEAKGGDVRRDGRDGRGGLASVLVAAAAAAAAAEEPTLPDGCLVSNRRHGLHLLERLDFGLALGVTVVLALGRFSFLGRALLLLAAIEFAEFTGNLLQRAAKELGRSCGWRSFSWQLIRRSPQSRMHGDGTRDDRHGAWINHCCGRWGKRLVPDVPAA